jgi:hypothetical protein
MILTFLPFFNLIERKLVLSDISTNMHNKITIPDPIYVIRPFIKEAALLIESKRAPIPIIPAKEYEIMLIRCDLMVSKHSVNPVF